MEAQLKFARCTDWRLLSYFVDHKNPVGLEMIQRKGNTLIVQGAVTFHNVAALTQQGIALLDDDEHMQVDLQKITEVDSTIISMLFEWLRAARKINCHLKFTHQPESLQSLAQLYGVTDMINPSSLSSSNP